MAHLPVTFTGMTVKLATVEIGNTAGGTTTVTINSSGTVVTLPVNGLAPDVISAISGERMSTFTVEYVADQAVAVPQVTQAEQAFEIETTGYFLSCQVVVTSVDTTISGADVMKVTLGMQSSGAVVVAIVDPGA